MLQHSLYGHQSQNDGRCRMITPLGVLMLQHSSRGQQSQIDDKCRMIMPLEVRMLQHFLRGQQRQIERNTARLSELMEQIGTLKEQISHSLDSV